MAKGAASIGTGQRTTSARSWPRRRVPGFDLPARVHLILIKLVVVDDVVSGVLIISSGPDQSRTLLVVIISSIEIVIV